MSFFTDAPASAESAELEGNRCVSLSITSPATGGEGQGRAQLIVVSHLVCFWDFTRVLDAMLVTSVSLLLGGGRGLESLDVV